MASDLPKLGAPAQRALASAGIVSLAQLATKTESQISELHGMGPKAMKTLKAALKASGKSYKK